MARRGEEVEIFVGKFKKSPLERPRHRWKDIINTGLQEYGGKTWTAFSWVGTDTTVSSCEGGK